MPLTELIEEWLPLPDVAEALGIEVGKVRRLVAERRLVGARVGERKIFQVPARLLVPAHLVDPAHVQPESPDGGVGVLTSLQGTLVVLADAGFSDEEAIEWLFSVADELGEPPIDALLAGHKARVRQIAQSLA